MRTIRAILVSLFTLGIAIGIMSHFPTLAQSADDPPESHLEETFWITDRTDLQAELASQQRSLSDWVETVNRSPLQFLCLGEMHTPVYRQFLAETLMPQLQMDGLMLETDAAQAEELVAKVNAGRAALLLGVDITGVIQAAQARNSNLQVIGIDQTRQQVAWRNLEQARSPRRRLSRDGFMAQNIREQLQPDRRYVALLGANHCAAYDLGLGNVRPLYRQLTQFIPADQLQSVLLLAANQNNPLALTLQRLQLAQSPFVLPAVRSIAPASYNFRWDLRTFFENYDAIVHFPPA
jgi:hypothetical protein